MGMFDSIMLNTECPYCGKEAIRECQTKNLDCILKIYNEGDIVKTDEKWLFAITDCKSSQCDRSNRGVGEFFDLKIRVKNNKITGKYKIL